MSTPDDRGFRCSPSPPRGALSEDGEGVSRLKVLDTVRLPLRFLPGAAYFSLVDLGGVLHLFYRGDRGGHSYTLHATSVDGINFSEPRRVLAGSHISHNFFAFDDAGTLRGVGGQIAPQSTKRGRDGLYRLQLDGERMVLGRRFLAPGHPGLVNAIELWDKPTEIDGHLCVVRTGDPVEYLLYLRSNPAPGVRAMQMARASRWPDFGPLKPAVVEGLGPGDNVYYPCFGLVDRHLVGVLPVVSGGRAFLAVVHSDDARVWYRTGELLPTLPWANADGDLKNPDHPVNGFVVRGDVVHVYVHRNYMGLGRGAPPYLERMTLRKRDLLERIVKS